MMLKSDYVAQIDEDFCVACGTCADERCQVNAIVEEEDCYAVKPDQCIGCGICVSICPSEAVKLVPKPQSEQTRPLKNLGEFYQQRALARQEKSMD